MEDADKQFRGAGQVASVTTFDREWDNLRRAHEWAVLTGDLRRAERLPGHPALRLEPDAG